MWWVDFGDPVDSTPVYRRPALIVSSDRFNRSRLATVIVCAITSNLHLAQAPGNVRLAIGEAELDRESVVNITQLQVGDRIQLLGLSGRVDRSSMRAVESGLRLVLGL